ncbi:hypothetical protein EYR40_007503 [Pleurotus pulmonarius]|nr:hypothetical protein EYR38_008194 [Pleurotus pulmonarius]KAF4597053.1 hypothetical protein EYR40_007503 [Pleurotus pulmonarius]
MGSSSSKVADAAPTRQDRQKCWEARDSYFACLDRAGVVKAGDEGKACKDENEKYEANCAKSWIEYFNQRRIIAEQQKNRLAQASNQAQDAKRL